MKKLIIVDAGDREAPFASALVLRYIEPVRKEPSDVEFLLAQAGNVTDALDALQPTCKQYESVVFIGAFFSAFNGKEQFSEAMKMLFAKWRPGLEITCFDRLSRAIRIYTERQDGKERKKEFSELEPRPPLLLLYDAIIAHFQTHDGSFNPNFLRRKRRDGYIQYCLGTAIDEYNNSENHESTFFNEFIRQVAYSPLGQEEGHALDYASMSGKELCQLLLSRKEHSDNLKLEDWKKLGGKE